MVKISARVFLGEWSHQPAQSFAEQAKKLQPHPKTTPNPNNSMEYSPTPLQNSQAVKDRDTSNLIIVSLSLVTDFG